MRWNVNVIPDDYTQRVLERFLWLPIKLPTHREYRHRPTYQWRWLERAKIRQFYWIDDWKNMCWEEVE